MTAIETLTNSQIYSLEDAQDLVTVQMLESLDFGEEIKLNSNYTLYHYSDEDIIVIVRDNNDEWEEVLQVMWSEEGIVFEAL
jgi:crotonobetainyl-CoA:carnitine CoA-transferase CaiB-like acyl-CoA transferase